MSANTCVICGRDVTDLGTDVCHTCFKKYSALDEPISKKTFYGIDLGRSGGDKTYCMSLPHKEQITSFAPLTIKAYQDDARRTIDQKLTGNEQLQEGVMGLCGEAGEANELVKKHLFQGHTLIRERVAKELGDALWYLCEAASAIGYDLEEIMLLNIEKRRLRYPDGFESERSVERKKDDL